MKLTRQAFTDRADAFYRGLESRPNVIVLHTCGKAMGSMGGLTIAADPILRDFR